MRVQHPPARLRPPLPRPVWPGPAPRRRWTSACGGARGERRDGLRTRLPGAEPVLRTGRQHVTLTRSDRPRDAPFAEIVDDSLRCLYDNFVFKHMFRSSRIPTRRGRSQARRTARHDSIQTFEERFSSPLPRSYAGQGEVGRARVTSGRRLCDALKPSSVARARQAAPTRSPSRQGSPATGA